MLISVVLHRMSFERGFLFWKKEASPTPPQLPLILKR
jgi:hypothetical protein